MKEFFLRIGRSIRTWLQSLSFRTGVIVLLCCIPFYILSFAQMLLPISAAAKGILWTVLFGMAKTCQYGGLTILGVEGYKRLIFLFCAAACCRNDQCQCGCDDSFDFHNNLFCFSFFKITLQR